MITLKLIKWLFQLVILAFVAAVIFVGYDFYVVYKKGMDSGQPKELAVFYAGKHTYERITSWIGKAQEVKKEVEENQFTNEQ